MVKKVSLLAMLIMVSGACLPASAVMVIGNLEELPFDERYYSANPYATKYILFDTTEIAGLTDAEIRDFLKSDSVRTAVTRKVLDFFYNSLGSYLQKTSYAGYELIYLALTDIGLDEEDNAHVISLSYYAMLAEPNASRLKARQSSADLDATTQYNAPGLVLTKLSSDALASYFKASKLPFSYQKGYTLEFEAEGIFDYENYFDDKDDVDYGPHLTDYDNRHKDYLQSLAAYQALIEAGYVLINLEIVSYETERVDLGTVKYRATFAKK